MSSPVPDRYFRGGAGRLSLDFVRTLRHRGEGTETEMLPDTAALTAWVAQFGPWPSAPRPAGVGQDAAARGLREAVYELIVVARSPQGIHGFSSRGRETVNSAALSPVPAPHLGPSGSIRWHADDPTSATLALIARDALDLVSSRAIDRVHECANPGCQALFLDSSRPGTRRWCSMNTCGNKAKKENLRGRITQPG
jgi:predicted RNA-binding Zn ribbon-like protein